MLSVNIFFPPALSSTYLKLHRSLAIKHFQTRETEPSIKFLFWAALFTVASSSHIMFHFLYVLYVKY